MIKITQYEACDGTLFSDEDECLEYERKSKLTENTYLQVWDHAKNKLGDSLFNFCADEVWYVKCNKEGMNYFNYLCEINNVHKIVDNNLYTYSDILYWCWDDDKYKWVNFDTQLQYVKDCCKMFGIPFEEGEEELQ